MAKILSNNCRLYLDAYDLTIGGQEISLSKIKEAKDPTTVNDTAEKRLMGAVVDAEFDFSGLFDDDSTGAFKGLKALVGSDTARLLSLHLGTAIDAHAILAQFKVSSVKNGVKHGELLPVSGVFAHDALAAGKSAEYGRVLYPKTTVTVSTNGGGLNNAASSASGAYWAYHVIAWSATGGNAKWTVALQESSNDGGGDPYAAKDGPVDITAVGATLRTVAGTIEQYTRLALVLDAVSGSITIVSTLVRL